MLWFISLHYAKPGSLLMCWCAHLEENIDQFYSQALLIWVLSYSFFLMWATSCFWISSCCYMTISMERILLFALRGAPQNSGAIFSFFFFLFACLFFGTNKALQIPTVDHTGIPGIWHLLFVCRLFLSRFVTLGTKLLLQVKANVWISAALGPNHLSFILWTNAVSQFIAQAVHNGHKTRKQREEM